MQPRSEMPIRILIVDDHAILRQGLRMLIENHSNMTVVGEAANGREALAVAARESPNFVLLDIDLGGENGLDLLNELLAVAPDARVLVLTGVRDAEMQRRSVRLGAMGVVAKEQAPEFLIKAIEKVHAGELWLDHSAIANVLAEIRRGGQARNGSQSKIALLTEREREIVALVAKGMATLQLANQLCISEKTVRNHMVSIYSKLQVANRLELALYALDHGLTNQSDLIPSGQKTRSC